MSAPLSLPPAPLSAGGRLWVGYSGGLDSTLLLDALAAGPQAAALRAVHVHHGLQPQADAWVRHCRGTCRALGVPLRVLRVEVRPAGEGLEAAARAARYAAIAALLRPGDVLATAHHRDDQAETVLFRALRGTGVTGLGGMRPLEALGHGLLWRPLLEWPRAALLAEAQRRKLSWIDDPHNRNPAFARTLLRHELWPRLAPRFPAASENLARLGRRAQAAGHLLAELAAADRAQLVRGDGLDIAGLLGLSTERRDNLLYHAWRALDLPPPDEAWYARLVREVLEARVDGEPRLVCGGGEARRYRGRLFLMRTLPPAPRGAVLEWTAGRRLALPPGCGVLESAKPPPAPLQVRFGSGGLRLRPAGAPHRRSLKQLCQEAGLPPWVRERLPRVERDGTLLWAGDRWLTDAGRERGLALRWHHGLPGGSSVADEGSAPFT